MLSCLGVSQKTKMEEAQIKCTRCLQKSTIMEEANLNLCRYCTTDLIIFPFQKPSHVWTLNIKPTCQWCFDRPSNANWDMDLCFDCAVFVDKHLEKMEKKAKDDQEINNEEEGAKEGFKEDKFAFYGDKFKDA